MRVRVTLDLNLPLCCGRVITFAEGGKSWVWFKYERLPNLCYWYGRLDYNDKNCELWIQTKGTLQVKNQQFGLNLQAAPYTSAGKDVIFVPRYYENRFLRSTQPLGTVVVSPPVEEVAPAPLTVVQPDLECEEIRDEFNAKSFSNSKYQAGKEGLTGEVNEYSIPNISG